MPVPSLSLWTNSSDSASSVIHFVVIKLRQESFYEQEGEQTRRAPASACGTSSPVSMVGSDGAFCQCVGSGLLFIGRSPVNEALREVDDTPPVVPVRRQLLPALGVSTCSRIAGTHVAPSCKHSLLEVHNRGSLTAVAGFARWRGSPGIGPRRHQLRQSAQLMQRGGQPAPGTFARPTTCAGRSAGPSRRNTWPRQIRPVQIMTSHRTCSA